MDLTLREAALLLSRSERTVRAQLARGELRGRKCGRSWLLRSEDLPLTASARSDLARRAEVAHEAVEASLPDRVRQARRRLPIAELELFRLGRDFLGELRARLCLRPLVGPFESGLRDVVLARHEFDPVLAREALRNVRRSWSEVLFRLLTLEADEVVGAELAQRLEQELLRRLGGMLRRSDDRARSRGTR